MIPRIRKGNDFKHIWPITWGGQPEDFSDATDITLTAKVYGKVKTLTEGVDYHIDGGTVMVDFTPDICDITGSYTVELNYIKPSAEFTDGDRRSAVDVQAFQIVNTSAEANATEGVSLPSEAMAAYALKYEDLTDEQKDELRGKGITSIDLTGEVGDTKTYTITYADGLTFDFSVTDGHTPIFTFVGTVLHIDGVPKVDLKGETGNGIASVELTSTVGLVKTYTITFTDDTTTTFTVTDGSTPVITFQGTTIYVDGVAGPDLKGEAGKGITSVELLSTVGLAKTYRITFTDATTFDYVVTDGAAGTGATVVQTTGESIVDVMSQKAVTDELDQLAGDVSLLDAVQGAKIKDIENVLSTANLGQSAQVSMSGRKVVSLPKNAANGGMSVKLEGLTAENEAVNGNFENGLITPFGKVDGFGSESTLAINSSTPISGNYDIRFTITTPATDVNRPYFRGLHAAANIGDKIYLHFYAKILSGTPILRGIHDGENNSTIYGGDVINGRNTRIIDVVGINGDLGTIYFNSFSVAWDMQMDNFMRINLTETFGAGNEPTVEECDLIFSDYFEGVKSFEPTGRVRSDIGGRNLLRNFKGLNWSNLTGSDVTVVSPYEIIRESPFVNHLSETNVYIEGGNTFTFSGRIGGNLTIYEYDSENVRIRTVVAYQNIQEITFTTLPQTVRLNIVLSVIDLPDGEYSFSYVKLEKGTIPTDWTPAPEDVLAGAVKGTGTSLYLTAPELRSNGAVKDEIRKGANGYELVKRISEVDGTVLANPVITPISYGGVLNSAGNGTVYHEPIIADAGVYETNLPILMQDYPIATIEEIIKHENGIDTYLNVASAVIASDGLSFTHPDLASGDLVLFTYAYDKESTNGNITATFYDSNVVKIDTETGKAYKIEDVVTNGLLTRTLTEV